MTALKLTPARKRGLAIMLAVEQADGRVRVSNSTSNVARCIYWQTADWLRKEGLAETSTGDGLVLTDEGRRLAAEVDS